MYGVILHVRSNAYAILSRIIPAVRYTRVGEVWVKDDLHTQSDAERYLAD